MSSLNHLENQVAEAKVRLAEAEAALLAERSRIEAEARIDLTLEEAKALNKAADLIYHDAGKRRSIESLHDTVARIIGRRLIALESEVRDGESCGSKPTHEGCFVANALETIREARK